ncbi:MAG: hypothetical protein JNL55_03530, partial [Steroidobacter sp.]|nr:hypothetical protein [Steroidobacter sp.]
YLAGAVIAFTFSGLVGQSLAPDPALATVPMALMTAATMATTIPASLLMGRFGRRRGLVTGAAPMGASPIAGLSIDRQNEILIRSMGVRAAT